MKNQYRNDGWVWIMLLLLLPMVAEAQTTYRGTVIDANNAGIPGVTVQVQETDDVTITNDEGEFTMTADPDDVLVLTKDGYLTMQYPLNKYSEFKTVLKSVKPHAGEDDDIVMPWGMQKKRYTTSAVSFVKTDDLPAPSTSALTSVFSGRLAGLNVLQLNTRPGEDVSSFQVRGLTAFGGRNALVLIDGIERELQDLDINEIEDVTVLKDAASLAWYGLRGSNGVVLITTKKGSPTKSSIHFDSQFGVQTPDHLINPLNSFEYASLYNEAQLNDDGTQIPNYDQASLDAFREGSDPYRFPDNNYVDEFIRKSTPMQRYALSTSGGTNRVRYFALVGYLNQQGLFAQTGTPNFDSNNAYKRFNFRANVDFDVTNSLKIAVNLGGRAEIRKNPGQDGATDEILDMIYATRPNAYPIINEDGTFGGNADFQSNILGELTNRGFRSEIQRVGLANFSAVQKLDALIPGLSANILYSYDTQGDYVMGRTENYQTFDLREEGTPLVYGNEARLGYLNSPFNNASRSNELWVGLDYEQTFGAHEVKTFVRAMRAARIPFNTIDERMQGLSARVNYTFHQRYLLSVVLGYSGDDDLPAGERYGLFPAISAGWVVSDEGFLKTNKIVTYLKLRGSHGKSGNGNLDYGRRFPYRTAFTRDFTKGGYQFGTGFSQSRSAAEVNVGNPFVTWETLTTTNAGVDLDLLNSLSASFDVFKNRRENILTAPAIPSILGQATGEVNEGIVESKGLETSLFFRKNLGSFQFSLNANLLISSDEIIYQGGQNGFPSYQSSIGHKVGGGLYYLSDGIYQSQDEIDNDNVFSTLSGMERPGDIRYKDIGGSGPGNQPDGIIDAFDRVRLDTRASPDTYFGFGTAFSYKIFDFNAQFAGVSGRTIDISQVVIAGPNGFNAETLKRWTPSSANTAEYPRLGLSDQGNNRAESDFWLRSADYVKLRTVELGISLPQNVVAKYNIQKFRLYASAYNPITFTKLDLDVDPELPYAGRFGSAYPYVRTYSVGVNLTL